MDTENWNVLPFDRMNASSEEYAAICRHFNALRKEHLPDDPPTPVEEVIQNLTHIPSFVEIFFWTVWDAARTEIVGHSHVVIVHTDENQHMAQFEISVLPGFRRQGIGRTLLAPVAEQAERENRRLLMTSTNDHAPAGEAFMTRIGGKKGLEAHTNQLRIDDLDRGLLAGWLEQGNHNLEQFELGFWDGAYPEDEIQAIAELYDLTNQQPLGELEVEDVHMTPDQIRQMEQHSFARGNQRWTYYLIDHSNGKFVGYTETVWNPNRPEILRQDMTGVFPQYRGRGFGRWLKAVMLDKVLRERPEVKYVRTGNADTNAAMLKINKELGFQPYIADSLWQVELLKVQQYLVASSIPGREG
jgi:GNAT superfamily N-acetyltransferase